MRTTVLVGVDGTGKSTVARRLADRDGVPVLHTIRPHEDPASTHAELSRALSTASAAADRVGRAQLKVAVLYLQLCLYRRAERRLFVPILLADRHPLIDPLVYLPLYAGIGADERAGGDDARWWDALPPAVAGQVRDWLSDRSAGDVWSLGNDLLRLAREPLPGLLVEIQRLLDVGLPDAVVLLDLPIEEALARVAARGTGQVELHESSAALADVRARYGTVLRWLAAEHPAVAVHTLHCAGRSVDDVASAVARLIGVPAPAPTRSPSMSAITKFPRPEEVPIMSLREP
jgi:thymidylate kinase